MLAREKPAGFIVQISCKEIAKASIHEPKYHRVAVNGVGSGESGKAFLPEVEGFVADTWSLGRLAEEAQSTHVAKFGQRRSENIDT